jgi:hypothetical protein
MYARLIGTGSCLPGNPVTNNDLAARGIDTNDEWIVTRTGIRSRYLAEPGTTSSELGLVAAQRALEMAGVAASDLDLIIVATSTPDFIFPSTACLFRANWAIKARQLLTCRRFAPGLPMHWELPKNSFVPAATKKCWSSAPKFFPGFSTGLIGVLAFFLAMAPVR